MLTFIICKYCDKIRDEVCIPAVLAVGMVLDGIILTTLASHL